MAHSLKSLNFRGADPEKTSGTAAAEERLGRGRRRGAPSAGQPIASDSEGRAARAANRRVSPPKRRKTSSLNSLRTTVPRRPGIVASAVSIHRCMVGREVNAEFAIRGFPVHDKVGKIDLGGAR